MLFALVNRAYGNFLLVVQVALASGHDSIVNPRLHHLGERPVGAHAQFLVCSVVAHEIDYRRRQFVAIHFVNPSLDGLHNLGVFEAVDMVPSASVASVRREEPPVVRSFEGDAEVVAL